MKLIVGLGNYPPKYHQTRHNAGFLCLDFLAQKHGFSEFKTDKKFFGALSEGSIDGQKTILLKPETYMNVSGKSIGAVLSFYKMNSSDLCLIYDDIDLDFGTVRYRERGSSGGHNGIKSTVSSIGTEEFDRIKIGVSTPDRDIMGAESFVLQKFSDTEKSTLPKIFEETEKKLIEKVF